MLISEVEELLADMKKFIGDVEIVVGVDLCGDPTSRLVTGMSIAEHKGRRLCAIDMGRYIFDK